MPGIAITQENQFKVTFAYVLCERLHETLPQKQKQKSHMSHKGQD